MRLRCTTGTARSSSTTAAILMAVPRVASVAAGAAVRFRIAALVLASPAQIPTQDELRTGSRLVQSSTYACAVEASILARSKVDLGRRFLSCAGVTRTDVSLGKYHHRKSMPQHTPTLPVLVVPEQLGFCCLAVQVVNGQALRAEQAEPLLVAEWYHSGYQRTGTQSHTRWPWYLGNGVKTSLCEGVLP